MSFPKEFTYEEMIVSQTAARHGIKNTPKDGAYHNLMENANNMLRVRKLMRNQPIIVSSGYRSPELNKLVPGSSNTSAHTLGYATDFTCPGFGSPLQIAHAIAESDIMDDVDQLIHEYNSWVHISWDPRNRKQLLTINKNGTQKGLH